MLSTQSGQPIAVQPVAEPERKVAQWTEPASQLATPDQLPLSIIIGGTIAIVVILVLIGVFTKDFTFYMGAAAIFAFGLAITSQRRKPAPEREVLLTTQHLLVGRSQYELSTLAGFWLESVGEVVAVNVEPKKAAMLPITFLYPSDNPEDTRQTLLEVLPELEPRQTTVADSLNKYFRF